MSLFSVVGITKAIREVASVIATPRRERIATAVTAAMLAKGDDEPMARYDNWREEFAREAIRFADDLIAELDRTAKPTPAEEAVRLLAKLLPHVGDTAPMEDIKKARDLIAALDEGGDR